MRKRLFPVFGLIVLLFMTAEMPPCKESGYFESPNGGGGSAPSSYAWIGQLPSSGWDDDEIHSFYASYTKCGLSGCVPFAYTHRAYTVVISSSIDAAAYRYRIDGAVMAHVITGGKGAPWSWSTANRVQLKQNQESILSLGNNGLCEASNGCLYRPMPDSGSNDVSQYSQRHISPFLDLGPANARSYAMASGLPGDGVTPISGWNEYWDHQVIR